MLMKSTYSRTRSNCCAVLLLSLSGLKDGKISESESSSQLGEFRLELTHNVSTSVGNTADKSIDTRANG
jgi:hypothetical protein